MEIKISSDQLRDAVSFLSQFGGESIGLEDGEVTVFSPLASVRPKVHVDEFAGAGKACFHFKDFQQVVNLFPSNAQILIKVEGNQWKFSSSSDGRKVRLSLSLYDFDIPECPDVPDELTKIDSSAIYRALSWLGKGLVFSDSFPYSEFVLFYNDNAYSTDGTRANRAKVSGFLNGKWLKREDLKKVTGGEIEFYESDDYLYVSLSGGEREVWISYISSPLIPDRIEKVFEEGKNFDGVVFPLEELKEFLSASTWVGKKELFSFVCDGKKLVVSYKGSGLQLETEVALSQKTKPYEFSLCPSFLEGLEGGEFFMELDGKKAKRLYWKKNDEEGKEAIMGLAEVEE